MSVFAKSTKTQRTPPTSHNNTENDSQMDATQNESENNNTAELVHFYKTKDGKRITTNDLFKQPTNPHSKQTENTGKQPVKHKQKRQRTSTSLPNSPEPNFDLDNSTQAPGTFWTKVQQSKQSNNHENYENKANNGDNGNKEQQPLQPRHHLEQTTKTTIPSLNQLSLFLKGENKSIINHAAKPHINYEKEITEQFGNLHKIYYNKKDDYIKIICTSLKQKEQILRTKTIAKLITNVTLPKCITQSQEHNDNQNTINEQNTTNKQIQQNTEIKYKAIIFDVPFATPTEKIIEHTNAITATKLKEQTKHGERVTPVILAFEKEIPESVSIEGGLYQTKTYIPKPIRCNKCQKFGHHTTQCKCRSFICSYCSDFHKYENCPNKRDNLPSKCANCEGHHSSAYTKCPKYIQLQKALELRAIRKIKLSQAKKEVELNSTQTTQTTRKTYAQAIKEPSFTRTQPTHKSNEHTTENIKTITDQIISLKTEIQTQNEKIINEIKNEISTSVEKIGQDIKHLHNKVTTVEQTQKALKEQIRKLSAISIWTIQNLNRFIQPTKTTVNAMETMVEIMTQSGHNSTEPWVQEIHRIKQKIAEPNNTSQNLQI